jgi:predicted nucleotidyltransferase
VIPLVEDKLEEIAKLCEAFAVRKLDLFGSAATGEFDEATSDVDFIYEFAEREGLDHFHRFFDFTDALEELLQRTVDLNPEPSGGNPIYVRSVNRSRVPVYRERSDRQAVA